MTGLAARSAKARYQAANSRNLRALTAGSESIAQTCSTASLNRLELERSEGDLVGRVIKGHSDRSNPRAINVTKPGFR